MFTGIILGLLAAMSQSFSYLFSRTFLEKNGGSPINLFVLSHIAIGAATIVILPLLWPREMPELKEFIFPLLWVTIFYLGGQFCLFTALKNAEASRISPLLGVKVFFLALLSAALMGSRFSGLQWSAVFLCICSALALNWTGGVMPLKSALWVLVACLGYSMSDLNIKRLVDCFLHMGVFQRSLFTASMSYALCGGICLAMLCFTRKISAKLLKDSLPFSAFWFASIIFLFACFAIIGPVFGNIVQSSRGIISITLGALAAGIGMLSIETKVSRGVFVRRCLAALLMMAAVALFYFGKTPAPPLPEL